MIDSKINAVQFLYMIKMFFALSIILALTIIFIFQFYRNKYLTILKNK
jgi:hypothetical protein